MATTALVSDLVAAGRELILKLEATGIVVDTALWLLDDETDEWRLVIASPDVDPNGLRNVYERVFDLLATMDDSGFSLEDVSVRSVSDRFIKDLKRRVQTNDGLHHIRLDYVATGGQLFRTVRIYRVAGGSLEKDARVKVRATGRLGTVRSVMQTPSGTRYMVIHDLRPEDVRPLDGTTGPPAGAMYQADELEFLYVVRIGA